MSSDSAPKSRSRATFGGAWLPPVFLLLLGTMWGSTFSLSKIAVEGGVHPLGYAFWQSFGAGAALLVICLLRGSRPSTGRRHLLYYLVIGQLGISIPNILFYYVIAHLPAGLMAVVITTAPLLTYIFAVLLVMEALRWQRALGILFGFAGALLLVLPDASLPSPDMTGWLLLSFLTPTFYAISTIVTARFRPKDGNSLGLAAGMLLGAATVQIPIVFGFGAFYVFKWPPEVPDIALMAQIVLSSLAYILYFELLRLAGPVYFSQVGYVVTLTGLLWGAFFFDERFSAWIYLATALILCGVALVNLTRDRAAKPSA